MSGKPSLGKGLPSQVKQSSQGRREPSGGAYTMFTPQQIKQFKEAFTMIDQDGNGRVTESDLREMLSNLGTYFSLCMEVVLKLTSYDARCQDKRPHPSSSIPFLRPAPEVPLQHRARQSTPLTGSTLLSSCP